MATAAENLSAVAPVPVRRFSVDEYQRMIRSGILTDAKQLELLQGWIVPRRARPPQHEALPAHLRDEVIGPRLPKGWFCRVRSAITTADSKPKPELTVVRGRPMDYRQRHPGPADTALALEIAETPWRPDPLLGRLKPRVYARAGIPSYWIINLPGARVEAFAGPSGPIDAPGYECYGRWQTYTTRRSVPLILDDHEVAHIPVRELLP
jgi:hypothetical protein